MRMEWQLVACIATAVGLGAWTPAQAFTGLRFESPPGDWVGQGATVEATPGVWTFTLQEQSGVVQVNVTGAGSNYDLHLAGPLDTTLAVGPHEEAARTPVRGTAPGIELSGNHRGCNEIYGRFSVLELQRGPGGAILAFAANFEQWCDFQPPLLGEIRYNSSLGFTRSDPAGDASPDPFALTAQGPVKAGTTVYSNFTRVYGINVPVPISITGGEYSVNGGAFTSQPGNVANRDLLLVRLHAARTAGALNEATLQVGGRSAKLSVRTYAPGGAMSGIYFESPPGDYVGDGQTRLMLSPLHRITAQRNFDNGVTVQTLGPAYLTYNADFAAAGDVPLTAGTYAGAMRFPFQSASAPGLSFTGDGRGCNTLTGEFTVHEVVVGPGGEVQSFAADFVQRCEGTMPPLRGEVRFNSTVPISALAGGTCVAGQDNDGDDVPDCVELDEARDPSVKDNDVFTNTRLFAMQQFRDFLAREGDGAGIEFWSGRIASGGLTRAQVIQQFLESPEFGGVVAPVARLYFAYFLRIPDKAGLDFWVDFRAAGNPMTSVSDAFAGSSEFSSTYGALDNAAFVDLVYRNVLARAPDAAGLAHWRGELDAGRMTRGQVMLGFSESAEYAALTANDVFVVMTYLGMLQRAPEPGGYAFWVDYMDKGNPVLALIDGFLRSAEYRGRFLP